MRSTTSSSNRAWSVAVGDTSRSLRLVCRPGDSRAKSLQHLQDCVPSGGPDEWRSVPVVSSHKLLDPGGQFLPPRGSLRQDVGKAATAHRSLPDEPLAIGFYEAVPAFNLIQP